MLQVFIDLNNRLFDRFSAEERVNIGIHTCPGGDCDSVHSKEVPYELLLEHMFDMNAGYFLIQCASEQDREHVYKLCGKYSREDANGVAQVCFMGVINPLRPEVESAEHVMDELLTAANYIPVERLGATEDCGFSPFSRDVKPQHGSRIWRGTSRCKRSPHGSKELDALLPRSKASSFRDVPGVCPAGGLIATPGGNHVGSAIVNFQAGSRLLADAPPIRLV